jgi:hypothetical protein
MRPELKNVFPNQIKQEYPPHADLTWNRKLPLMMLLGALALGSIGFGQTQNQISGRLFLVTKGGDLKPARLAGVVLFGGEVPAKKTPEPPKKWNGTPTKVFQPPPQQNTFRASSSCNPDCQTATPPLAPPVFTDKNFPLSVYLSTKLHKHLVLIRDELKWLQEGHSFDESVACKSKLSRYVEALSFTKDWAALHNKAGSVQSAQTDEEGNFKLTVPYTGLWMVVGMGHAGMYESYWEASVTVEQGQTAVVKMGSPEQACKVSLED